MRLYSASPVVVPAPLFHWMFTGSETLEEIAVENGDIFKHNGGEQFTHIPCLNDSEPGMLVIWTLVLRELKGWV